MKRLYVFLLLFFPILLVAQQNEQAWKQVDSLVAIKNYQQTLPILNRIKTQAKTEQNSPEWIKAVIAEINGLTVNQNKETKIDLTQEHFEKNIKEANLKERAVLYNLYAIFLQNYVQNQVINDKNNYLALTRDKKLVFIDSLYQLSIRDESLLLNEETENWKDILNTHHFAKISPTLYHILAFNYHDFLNLYAYVRGKVKSLTERFNDINSKNGYIDAQAYLKFYPYLNNYYDVYFQQYETKIDSIAKSSNSVYNAFAYLSLAHSMAYQNIQKAVNYINIALEKYPNSPWQNDLIQFKNELTKSTIDIEHKLFAPSNEYVPIKVEQKNIDKLFIRVYDVTNNPKITGDYKIKHDSLTNQVSINAKLIYEEEVALKRFDDYKEHSTNYKINPLPYGNYKIVASNNPEFIDDNLYKDVTSSDIIITDLFISSTYSEFDEDYDQYKTLLINRKTGLPYSNEHLELYDYIKGSYSKVQSVKTNKNGEFSYKSDGDEYEDLDLLDLYIPKENQFIDLIELDDIEDITVEEEEDFEDMLESLVFTDRSIYRPGQEIFFKAIVYNNHYKDGKVLPNKPIKIYLTDANRAKIDSLESSTNEFGSLDGKFILPSKTLNGNFIISTYMNKVQIGNEYFRVEEYKRPTFKVDFDENKETYTKKDTAVFIGKAVSLSGANLSDAFVKYKVSYYNKNYNQIIHLDSSMTTDSEGKFKISFPLSDTLFRNLDEINFTIEAIVTNQNGEVQNVNTHYNYSAKPWVLVLSDRRTLVEHQWKQITIKTQNQNQQPLPMNGMIKIYKVLQPTTVLSSVNNFEFKEDYHLFSNEEYSRYFPNDFDEILLQENPRTLVKEYAFDSQGETSVKIDSSLFSYGKYQVEAISIQGLDTIKTRSDVTLLKERSNKYASNQLLTTIQNKTEYFVGDIFVLTFESDSKDMQTVFLKSNVNSSNYETIYFKNGKGRFTHKITEADLKNGSYQVEYFAICNNKFERGGNYAVIKNSRKDLSIQIKTFRDKITPGQTEKWSFSVANQTKGTSVELLASLYDSALDVFNPHEFPREFYIDDVRHNLSMYFIVNEFTQVTSAYNMFDKPYTYRVSDHVPKFYLNERYPGLFSAVNFDKRTSNLAYSERNIFGSNGGLDEVVVTALQGRVAGINLSEEPFSMELFESETLYDELIDPDLRAEVERLKRNQKETILSNIEARTNLKETAFFYPTLYTDQEGNVTFEFESPEALTRWKLLLFAHTKNLDAGSASFFTQTQKQLMVRPNLPRYFREGDQIELKAQVQNLSDSAQNGTARIELIDPRNNQVINEAFGIVQQDIYFAAGAKGNTVVSWKLTIPAGYEQIQVKIVAASETHSDGEAQELAILPNKEFMLETQKIVLEPNQQATYLISSEGKENRSGSISIQSNPILEIISALDYLKNYPYECTEQTSSKWFALTALKHIHDTYPQIAAYFASVNKTAAQSKMSENTAAASTLSIEEMPWLRSIKNDEERLNGFAELFASDGIDAELKALESKLKKAQKNDGSMPWFEGSTANQTISARVLEIIGKAKALDPNLISEEMNAIAKNLSSYLDQELPLVIKEKSFSNFVDMLYARAYFKELPLSDSLTIPVKAFMATAPVQSAKLPAGLAAKPWVIAQSLGLQQESQAIFNRLDQEFVLDKSKGQYWESNANLYNGISLHTYLVEAYRAMSPEALPALTDWIYYSKQANYWSNTWTTVDAIYSLLLVDNPADFVVDNQVAIKVNQQQASPLKNNLGQEMLSYEAKDLEKNLSVEITNKNQRKVYGQVVHGYFETFDNIKSTNKEISVSKEVLVLHNGEWRESNNIKTGDKVKVRLTVVNNQDLNFVHLKDSRAVGFEPIYQPSGYQYRGGYYFTIKDASTNYFFDTLRKGTHVFEYELKTNNTGVFNSGIARIECMYNPTVHSNSENLVIQID
ncbi:alpha-2-macroglobulin family protein [Sphingobacterium hungaricum]|uniref:Alpha-2-macroglobulin n=1 Tax=Sphingobacterium hungaricum TaxID=2082723 RepID=A0A928YS79_9SPHI|nr:alpha-2-macroglobulin family protein [Sphingobacterium hungaricum]MBE8715452.1 alpha-2-macroglobulin [Sphingobacterium hungaricum]